MFGEGLEPRGLPCHRRASLFHQHRTGRAPAIVSRSASAISALVSNACERESGMGKNHG